MAKSKYAVLSRPLFKMHDHELHVIRMLLENATEVELKRLTDQLEWTRVTPEEAREILIGKIDYEFVQRIAML